MHTKTRVHLLSPCMSVMLEWREDVKGFQDKQHTGMLWHAYKISQVVTRWHFLSKVYFEINIDTVIRSDRADNWRVRPCPGSRCSVSRHLGGNMRHKMCHKIRMLTLNTIGIWSARHQWSGKVSKSPTTVIVTVGDSCDQNLKTLCSELKPGILV